MDPKDRIIRYIYVTLGIMFFLLGIALKQHELLQEPLKGGLDAWEKILDGYLTGIKKPWE